MISVRAVCSVSTTWCLNTSQWNEHTDQQKGEVQNEHTDQHDYELQNEHTDQQKDEMQNEHTDQQKDEMQNASVVAAIVVAALCLSRRQCW